MAEKLEAWRIFLRGRMAQEEGKIAEGSSLIEDALRIDPDNPFFLKARSNALAQLNKSEESAVSRVESRYAELARKYVGKNDKPGPWIEGLKKVERDTEVTEIEALVSSMAW
jgi:hypothetical protein